MLSSRSLLHRGLLYVLAGLLVPSGVLAFCLQPTSGSPLAKDAITVIGAVEQAGIVGSKGARVDDAIADAGGLREDAYPLGAMLYRRLPDERGDSATAGVERDLVAGALDGLQVALSGPFGGERRARLIAELRTEGRFMRVPVAADAALQRRFPERNPALAPGDVLFLPTRPETVTVIGAVRSPGQMAFHSGATADDYLEQAGGWLPGARRQRSAVYLPDGKLRDLSLSFWNYKPTAVPPGSIIVVPYRDESLQKYARDMLGASMFAELAQRQKSGDSAEKDPAMSMLPNDPGSEYSMLCR